ncbi:12686_t:CDS:2, partial [Acaulospora colombiana]
MFQQAVTRDAAKIAQELVSQCSQHSEKDACSTAANTLRFPSVERRYWDWIHPDTGRNGVPAILTNPATTILNPLHSQPITVPNPLCNYRLSGMNKNFKNSTKYLDIPRGWDIFSNKGTRQNDPKELEDNDWNYQHFASTGGTFGTKKGSIINNKTPLVPFRKDDGAYWTSDDARCLVPSQGHNKCMANLLIMSNNADAP